jgi:integrase
MATVTFVLKQPRSDKETPVFVIFWLGRNRLKLATHEKIRPSLWDQGLQRAKKSRREFPEFVDFNQRLDNIQNALMNTHRRLIIDGVKISKERLKIIFKSILRPDIYITPDEVDLFQFIDDFITNIDRAKTTIKGYRTTLNHLKTFQKEYSRKVGFSTIDLEFRDAFIHYFKKLGYRRNTIGKNIKNIKVFMAEAQERGYKINDEVRSKKFQTPDEPTFSIYLTETEIDKLFYLNLTKKPRLERVRDMFIIGCDTGLRFSDLSNLTRENFIDNNSKIRIQTIKTKETVEIPVRARVAKIFIKYEGQLPRVPSNQKMNEYLKELGNLAQINELVINPSIVKDGKKGLSVHKYTLITTHTARRSFATNAYLGGVPTISIMKITGHQLERTFLQYIKISAQENADNLREHPFFKHQ